MYVDQLCQMLHVTHLCGFQGVNLEFGHCFLSELFFTTLLKLLPQGDDISNACPRRSIRVDISINETLSGTDYITLRDIPTRKKMQRQPAANSLDGVGKSSNQTCFLSNLLTRLCLICFHISWVSIGGCHIHIAVLHSECQVLSSHSSTWLIINFHSHCKY